MKRLRRRGPARPQHILAATIFLLATPIAAYASDQDIQPEVGTGTAQQTGAIAEQDMVVAANPHAAKAGAAILAEGGSAVDAAIAMQLVLNLVEPQSSGIGGGAFLLHYQADTGAVASYDGRETAPAGATEDMFLNPDGSRPGYLEALVGGESVGAPGLLRMLEMAHEAHGRLPWSRLFEPAIALAESGFAISPRLNNLAGRVPTIQDMPAVAHYLLDGSGQPKAVGTILRNQTFADSLRQIAEGGADVFYTGDIAADIAAAVQHARVNPGTLSVQDIAGYQAKQRPAVCMPYRAYRICGMGPPSSGGITVLQILGLLAPFELSAVAPDSVEAVHLFAEANRLAYADRDLYIADPDFVDVPVSGLIDADYLRARSRLIDPSNVADDAVAGVPPGAQDANLAPARSPELPATSHLSVVDRDGNAAALTTSIEFAFGSALMVRGFLLNNQLTDFSFTPERDGRAVANRVEPGKRPRSSMAPTLVFDAQDRLVLVVGSPGGSRIICYVAKTLVAVLDWDLDIQAAVDLPHRCNRGGATEVEQDSALESLEAALGDRGHTIRIRDMNSGIHAIHIRYDTGRPVLHGAADPRREGQAIGR